MANDEKLSEKLIKVYGIEPKDEDGWAQVLVTPEELLEMAGAESHFSLTVQAIGIALGGFYPPVGKDGKALTAFMVNPTECLTGIGDESALLKFSSEQKEAAGELELDLSIRGSGFETSNSIRGTEASETILVNSYLNVEEMLRNGRLVLGPIAVLIAKTFTLDNRYDGAVPRDAGIDSTGKPMMSDDVALLLAPAIISNIICFPIYWKITDEDGYQMVCTGKDRKGNPVSADSFQRTMIAMTRRYLPILNNIGNSQGRLLRAHMSVLISENTGEDPCTFGQNAAIVQITRVHFAGYRLLNSYLAQLQQPSKYQSAFLTPRQIADLLESIAAVLKRYRKTLPLAFIASANMQNVPSEFSSIVETTIADNNIVGRTAGTSRRSVVRLYRELEYQNLLVSGPIAWRDLGSKLA